MKRIQILGAGCPKCKSLTANAERAAQEAGVEFELEKIQDINEIIAFGVMTTPALAVDGRVVSAGKVLSPTEIQTLIQ